MRIGGFQRNTLVDYPGLIASTIFLPGCNFHCGYCHNPGLVHGECDQISVDEILEYLEKASKKIIDGVCITGGEPTLYAAEVRELISKLKNLGLKVKLDTNGSNPDVLKSLDVDYVAMDLKTSVHRYGELSRLPQVESKIQESIEYLVGQDKFQYEFRTTLAPNLVGVEEIESLGQQIVGAPKWNLQKYRNQVTLDPKYSNIAPYSDDEHQELLQVAKKFVPYSKLR